MSSSAPHRLSLPVAALIGVASVGAALGVGHLVGTLINPMASPLLAVGSSAIDLTPAPLKTFAVATFGTYDKLVLLLGMAIVIAVVAALAGMLSRRSPAPGLVVIVILGVVGGIAVLARPGAGVVDALAPAASLAVGVVSFAVLHRLAEPRPVPAGEAASAGPRLGRRVGRRRVLLGSGTVAATGVLAGLGGVLRARSGGVQDSRAALGRITPDEPAPPIPAGADFAAQGTPTFITPNSEFYRVDINLTLPQLRAEDWQLRIHGMVDRELLLDWDDLTSRRSVERTVTLTCVSNEVGGPYISTSNFTGVMLRDLLEEAGVRRGADQVFTTSVDGWTCGTPTDVVTQPGREAMLVYAMNREPLPIEHGFPVRMLVPGLYGFVSATKWITDLELTTFAAKQAYWLQRDWGQRAPIKTMSRIDSPGSFEKVVPGTPITGIAWAQPVGIERVEVSVDGGAWQPAELSTEVNTDTWRMWRLPIRLEPGLHQAQVRATDKSGYTQTPQRVMPIPDGATGWHSVQFTVQ